MEAGCFFAPTRTRASKLRNTIHLIKGKGAIERREPPEQNRVNGYGSSEN
jgi:hypothetical protein